MGILLLLFAVTPGLLPRATPVRAADAACEGCHQQIYRSYLQTPMANASGPAADRLIPGTFYNRLSQVDYTLSRSGEDAVLSWRDMRKLGVSGTFDLTYFLGSGHLGTTWLYSINGYLFESPVAWYAASNGYDMKPGLARAAEMLPALPMQSDCMRCHMSDVEKSDSGSMNHYSGPAFLHAGITCESCHGDTRQHVLTGGKTPVVNPAQLPPEKRDSVCISCHLEGDTMVERAGRSGLDYRPGDAISDDLAYYVYAQSDPMARGVSEVEQFSQSMCKRMSGDRMSCTSCHDPHYTPLPAQRVTFYRTKCLACHGSATFVRTHFPANPDCIGCHMPHNGAENIPHVAWTDHRILRNPSAAGAAPSAVTKVLKPIFSPGATSRDLGMAYYMAYLEGNRSEDAAAWQLLNGQRQALQNDVAALDALAVLSVERGDSQAGESDFRRILALDPKNLTAQSDLGILLARQGRFSESVQMLRNAFARNQDVAGLAMNLAHVECAMGDTAGLRSTLQTALLYNPDVAAMQQLLTEADSCASPNQTGAK